MLFSRRGRGSASPTYAQVTTEDEEAGDDIKWRPAARPAPSTPLLKFLYTLAKRLAVIAIVIVVLKLLPSIKPIRRGIRVLVNYPQQVALRTTEEMFEHAGPRSRALAGVADGKFRHWLRGVQDAHGAYPEGQFSSGAGIVFCGGGAGMLRQVMGQILYLRETLGCTLPVEVMHLGEEEMTDGWRAALQALPDTRVVDLYSLIDPLTQEPVTRPVGSFTHVKPAVVLLSSFEEVIFLDTNNYAMIDPGELLLRDQYKRDGYLMWSDLWLSTSIAHEYAVYSLLQVPPPPGFENSESGVMYWDKRRRWKELVTAWALAKPLAARGTIDGDKQMYGFAFAATGQTLTHTFPRAGVVGMLRPTHALHLPGTRSVSFQPLGIHQPDPADGGPGFFHSMGFTKSLRPFSRRGVSHVLNVAGAEADPGFTMLDLSTSHSPYGLGRAVAMDAARQARLLTGLPAGVRMRAQAARDVSDDPRVVAAFGVDHPDFALTALSWFMGRS